MVSTATQFRDILSLCLECLEGVSPGKFEEEEVDREVEKVDVDKLTAVRMNLEEMQGLGDDEDVGETLMRSVSEPKKDEGEEFLDLTPWIQALDPWVDEQIASNLKLGAIPDLEKILNLDSSWKWRMEHLDGNPLEEAALLQSMKALMK